MRIFALLVASVTLALFLTAVYAPRSAMANRSGAHAAHPIASIGDIFRGY
ncbi:hypothetical protein [Pseudomonas sp. CCOS 191]|nr:hypothetical protein [Pseudomonas sp. CCOS 191]CRI57445.1 putative membrane protein [Pseudomonas sp. CCOS 191]